MERFTVGGMLVEDRVPVGREAQVLQWLVGRSLGELVLLGDSGTAGDLVTLRHGLGRVPRGIVVVNMAVGGSTPLGWYRMEGVPDWTGDRFSVRFTVSGASGVLWVI